MCSRLVMEGEKFSILFLWNSEARIDSGSPAPCEVCQIFPWIGLSPSDPVICHVREMQGRGTQAPHYLLQSLLPNRAGEEGRS